MVGALLQHATGVLKLTLRPHKPLTARFVPAVVSSARQPVPLHSPTARRAARSYARLRSCTGLSAPADVMILHLAVTLPSPVPRRPCRPSRSARTNPTQR